MSKSRGNVVNPDDIVKQYGADTLRLYEMFMGPLEASKPWADSGVEASRKWLDRVWRLMMESDKLSDENDHHLDYSYHFTVKKVTEDFASLNMNTAISQMMIFINDCYKCEHIYRPYALDFIKMLSCVAPHVCEEMYTTLTGKECIANETWPTYDENQLKKSEIEVIAQVNGKLRGRFSVPTDADEETIRQAALELANVKAQLEGKTVRKIIVVKGKVVNIVAN